MAQCLQRHHSGVVEWGNTPIDHLDISGQCDGGAETAAFAHLQSALIVAYHSHGKMLNMGI
jgi:hypothetical protein